MASEISIIESLLAVFKSPAVTYTGLSTRGLAEVYGVIAAAERYVEASQVEEIEDE